MWWKKAARVIPCPFCIRPAILNTPPRATNWAGMNILRAGRVVASCTDMLRRLSIQDFVIVTALDMEFEAGLTVFSGETCAGKSILIDALSLLCGARAEADVIRAGCARAQLSAEFELTEPARRCLAAQALDTETEPNAIQLRRAIDCNGRSRAFINGTPV